MISGYSLAVILIVNSLDAKMEYRENLGFAILFTP